MAFGTYVHAYTSTTNTMEARSTPAIALRESNDFGGHYFMSLISGRRFHSREWDELPIRDEIIEKVHELAKRDNQPSLTKNNLLFKWGPGSLIQYDFEEEHVEDIENVREDNIPNNFTGILIVSDNEDNSDDEHEGVSMSTTPMFNNLRKMSVGG